jgi:hypothetical protein
VTRVIATLAALLLIALPAVASADVDPASDVLLFQNEFFPRVKPPSTALKNELTALTKQANDKGYNIKVAIIGARLDLGGAPQLYRHPDQYAKFLGTELRSATGLVQPLLVIMKGGVGTYGMGDEANAVKNVKVPDQPSGEQLTQIGIDATKAVSAAAGHPLSAVPVQPAAAKKGGGSSGGAPLVAFMAPVGLLLVLGLLLWFRRRTQPSEPAP